MAKKPNGVLVLPVKGREAEIAQLQQSIVAAGCELVCNQAVVADYEKCLKQADVLVILMCAETDGDEKVMDLTTLAAGFGKRIVGVWVRDSTATELPPAINRHGDAGITMDKKLFEEAVCGGKS